MAARVYGNNRVSRLIKLVKLVGAWPLPKKTCRVPLFVNADVRAGELRVEVLVVDCVLLEGFGCEACVAVSGNSTCHAIRWREAAPADLAGRSVRLRFWIGAGELYSFWLE